MKRTFIGIDLPEKVKEIFNPFFKAASSLNEVKWEKPEKLHLTLVFLGWANEKKISELVSILSSMKTNWHPFKLSIMPFISGFPTPSNPRVLWLPIEGEVGKLANIAKTLQKDKREFHAHLTIGRFKNSVKRSQKEEVLNRIAELLPKKTLEFKVNSITLFESKLTTKGSIYSTLYNANFSPA